MPVVLLFAAVATAAVTLFVAVGVWVVDLVTAQKCPHCNEPLRREGNLLVCRWHGPIDHVRASGLARQR